MSILQQAMVLMPKEKRDEDSWSGVLSFEDEAYNNALTECKQTLPAIFKMIKEMINIDEACEIPSCDCCMQLRGLLALLDEK